ncbi:apolipoprotein C-II-like [Heptranchias perlo]|uniref:apolipoprotein C-II-like n=1 Tax=Heptranchias perlo TaxID=212740 RepID=UPI003559A262
MKMELIALALILLAVCSGEARPLTVLEDEPVEGGFTDKLWRYWDNASTQVTEWIDSASSSTASQYLKAAFNGSSTAITTYTNILMDQVMHLV